MGYSLQKQKENEGKIPSNFEHPFQSSFYNPPPQNQSPKHYKFGEWAVDQRWVTQDQLAVALKEQTRSHKRVGEVMLDLGFLSTEQLLKALSTLSGFPSILLTNQILNLSVVQQIPFEVAKRHQLILFEENNNLEKAVRPLSLWIL